MKKVSKILALLLAVALVAASISACEPKQPVETTAAPAETTAAPVENDDDKLAAEVYGNSYSPENWEAESTELYETILADFLADYAKVKDAKSLSERYALQAIAEATMYGSAIFVPTITRGGNYRLGRTVPKSVNTTMWGSNEYRYHTILVTEDLLKAEDWNALKVLWAEKAGTGEYIS